MIFYMFDILTIKNNAYVVYLSIITKNNKFCFWELNLTNPVSAHLFNKFITKFNFLSIQAG